MAFRTPSGASRRAGLALLAGIATAAACADTGTVVTGVVHPTLVEVSPSEFLQGVPCLDAPGAMRSYVATVWDIGEFPSEPDGAGGAGGAVGADDAEGAEEPYDPDDWAPFALPSSGPVACTQPVGFARVVAGHHYVADIEGYDRPGLEPLAPGSPIMINPETGERVEPRWTSRCGGPLGVIAHDQRARTIRECTPLVDAAPSELTAVVVSLDSVLGSLTCGEEPGQVSRYEVERSPGERLEAACGEPVVIADVTAGTNLRLPVLAYQAGDGAPAWGTTCTALAAAGAIVPASCTTLTDKGGVDVNPALVLAAYGLDCSALGELVLGPWTSLTDPENPLEGGEPRTVRSTDCETSVRFGAIPRGPADVPARLVDATGTDLGSALCNADVVPNQAVPAACALEP